MEAMVLGVPPLSEPMMMAYAADLLWKLLICVAEYVEPSRETFDQGNWLLVFN
jgi:hypothetical protein